MYRRSVQTTLKASYTNHYRRGLIELLDVLEFRSSNTAHRLVLDALELVARHKDGRFTFYPAGEHVPDHKGVLGDWADLVRRTDDRGRTKVVRSTYEVCTFQALRERLRCKEIWVVGAIGGATRTRTCPAISKRAGSSTTRRCASHWTRPRSSTNSRPNSAPSSPR